MRLLLGILIGGALILASFLVARSLPSSRARSPVVRVDPESYNFGHVSPGSYAETSFVIRNEGTVPLEFGKVTRFVRLHETRPPRSIAPARRQHEGRRWVQSQLDAGGDQ